MPPAPARPLPPPPPLGGAPAARAGPNPPQVASKGPAGAFLVELSIYNGYPFTDHWAYFVRSPHKSSVGVSLHATGDVRNGFKFEIKRSLDFESTSTVPIARIPLQWIDGKHFNEEAMFNNGNFVIDTVPVCEFETSASKVKAPGKSLNSASTKAETGNKVVQRNCQTWIVEAADQLVVDDMFYAEVATYLHALKQ